MKVLKNYLYNVIYQIITIILPIITVPYISRIFSPEQIGVNAYTYSIVQYFVLFAGLGVGIYGNRTIAYIKDDDEKRIKIFWSLFFAVFFTTTISLIIYFLFIFIINGKNLAIQLIQSLYIVTVPINISWLFMGMEDFKKIVTRNTIVKIIGVISIFLFVKNSDDLKLYVIILASINLFGFLSMWIYLPQYIKGFYFDMSDIKSHFIPLFRIYIPQVAMQVYVIMDKTFIGILSNESQVGYYDMSQRIVKIVLSILTSLGVVMIPHISNLLSKNKHDEVEKNIADTFSYMSYLAFPMAFGLSVISKSLAYWFFGPDFAYTGIIMSYSAFIIIAITWSNIIGMQLLMPMMKEKEFTISVIGGALINVIINVILIPYFGALGAIIATIFAEFTVTIIQIIFIQKYINIICLIKSTWKSAVAALVMSIVVYILTINFPYTFVTNIIQVSIGILIYGLIMFILKSDVQKTIIQKIRLSHINKLLR